MAETSTTTTARTAAYAYDDLYRLVGETISGDPLHSGTVGYTLDKVGNREARVSTVADLPTRAGLSFNGRDQLSTDTYDANGNTVTGALGGMGVPPVGLAVTSPDIYDFEDRLILRTRADGSTVNLSYDADGLRTRKTLLDAWGGLVSSTSYLVCTNNLTGYAQVMEERATDASGTTLKTYTYGHDLLSVSGSSTSASTFDTRYYVYDGGGSVRALADETGAITDRYTYDAFGVLLEHQGTSDNAYLYRGEQWDADLGLYYLRARFMNPDSGRFWNQDTYEGSNSDPASLHKYLYAHANPVTFIDPSGHFSMVEVQNALFVVGTLARMAVPSVVAVGKAAYVMGVTLVYSKTALVAGLATLSGVSALVDGGGFDDALIATALGYYFAGGSVSWSASRSPSARYLPSSSPNPRGGMPASARYAQKSVNAEEQFSEKGREIYSALARRPINTIDDLAQALRQNIVKAQDLPVEYVVRPNGNPLIHNTRTAEELRRAGIPRANWNAIDMSDDAEVVSRVTNQLNKNKLDDNGVESLE